MLHVHLRSSLQRRGCFLHRSGLGRWASNLTAARAKERQQASDARARGAVSVDTRLVDSLFSVSFGLLFGAWYFGWLDSKTPAVQQMVQRLRDREFSVVVFELDGVMCVRPNHHKRAVPSHEVEDYLQGVSQDFLEAAAALARRGFHLAAIADAVATQPTQRWQEAPGELLTGPELARALLTRRCPEAASSFRIVLGSSSVNTGDQLLASRESQMGQVAAVYGEPMQRLVLFTASRACARDGVNEWTGVLVRDPSEGFRLEDSAALAPPARLSVAAASKLVSTLVGRGEPRGSLD
mmetsp:Transcript_89362/g.208024  ORF Transcript_89362/g.208024 Transcript_89362/m.208024 type:complete len:295 (+) Transcript_89362:49-933(+)